MQRDTQTIRTSTEWDGQYGSIGTPLYLTSNFRFRAPGETTGYDYTRSGNPTRSALEEALAGLEGGAGALQISVVPSVRAVPKALPPWRTLPLPPVPAQLPVVRQTVVSTAIVGLKPSPGVPVTAIPLPAVVPAW